MMKKTITFGLILSTLCNTAYCQAPPKQDIVNRPTAEPASSPHGADIPVFDPTNKTYTFQGKTYSLGSNNLGGQFEAYLASSPFSSKGAEVYRTQIRQILDYLAHDKTDGAKLKEAYELLSKASTYEGDGQLCESLANSVYSAQLTVINVRKKKLEIDKLKTESKKIIKNLQVIESRSDIVETKKPPPAPIEAQFLRKNLAEIELKIKKIDTEITVKVAQSKLYFQSMLVQLFIQRRFEHVVMGTRFYNLVYLDGDNKLNLKKGSDAHNFFTKSIGVEPSVAGLDAASSEAIRKVKTLVSAFQNDFKAGRIHAASNRIMEAFIIGEFIPIVQNISSKEKAPIQQYIQEAQDMVKVLQANDLELATKLNISLQKQAKDYNPSEANSYIAAKKTESQFNVRDAKIAYGLLLNSKNTSDYHNQHTRFNKAMDKATKAWPSNPELEELIAIVDNSILAQRNGNDMLLSARKDFDRLVDTKAHTSIMKKENLSKFLASFTLSTDPDDKERAKLLDEISEQTSEIFATIKEAETYYNRGLASAAWELVDIANKQHPNNLELAKAKALYSSQAATFSNIISKAQILEKDSPTSARALTWYLKAENIYPDSQYAREGINRIIKAKFGTKIEPELTMN